MYQDYGFALHIVCLKDSQQAIGICGLLKRETLPEPDIGFAFLDGFSGKGFGYESAQAILNFEVNDKKLTKILAITALENLSSQALLMKQGFVFDKTITLADRSEESNLYGYQ